MGTFAAIDGESLHACSCKYCTGSGGGCNFTHHFLLKFIIS